MMPLGSGLSWPWGHKLNHRNKEDKFQNSSFLKVEGPRRYKFKYMNKEEKNQNSHSLKLEGIEL